MNVTIKIIPHKKQRYNTCGDWWWTVKGDLEIRVSRLDNWKYEFLIAVHEFIEAILCKDNNVLEEDVTEFDEMFEVAIKGSEMKEPGDSEKAPYHPMHFFATSLERLLSQALGVSWNKYEEEIDKLDYA